jgi:hypothetical protein
MKLYVRPFTVIVLIALSSCVERIDISLDESYTRLVVDGAFTTDTIRQKISLTRTSSYYYNQPAPPVEGAVIDITDGVDVYDLREESPGVYTTEYPVYGVPGRIYTLNISLASPVGGYKEYTASAELFPVSTMDSLQLEFHPDWSDNGIWEVKCYVQDPPTPDYYRFRVLKNSVMLSDSLDEWFVTDDRFFNGNYAYGAPVAYLRQNTPDEVLLPGDTVAVEMNSLGKEYAYFIWDAQAEVNGSNPLFSGPPSNVRGNVSNGAIGFFSAYSVSRAYVVVPESFK